MRALLATLATLFMLAAACGGAGRPAGLEDVLTANDVPDGWAPADFDEAQGRALWDALPALLTSNAEARLLLQAFEDGSGTSGAAVIFVEAEEAAAIPATTGDQRVTAPLARLLTEQEALLGPDVRGGDPGAYFTVNDVPPGSLRSRLVRLLDEDYLFSDSIVFSSGPVLAVVTVWYPEDEGPFRDIEDLAAEVESRLRDYLRDA
jgi:hypothetical protein